MGLTNGSNMLYWTLEADIVRFFHFYGDAQLWAMVTLPRTRRFRLSPSLGPGRNILPNALPKLVRLFTPNIVEGQLI